MNLLTTINQVPNRAWRAQWAALVLATLVFLSGLTSPARAQGGRGAGKVVVQDLHFMSTVGVAREQMLRITVPIPNNQDRSGTATGKLYLATNVGVFAGHVKVFDGLTGAEIASFELRNPTAGLHTFDIGGSGNDVLLGGAGNDANRVQLWIEVKLFLRYDREMKEPGEGIFPPTIEVVDKFSGRTTVYGTLYEVRHGSLGLPDWWASAPLSPPPPPPPHR